MKIIIVTLIGLLHGTMAINNARNEKKETARESLRVGWHPLRCWGWCMLED